VHVEHDIWSNFLDARDSPDALSRLPLPLTGDAADSLCLLYTALTRAKEALSIPPSCAAALDAYPGLAFAHSGECSACQQDMALPGLVATTPLWMQRGACGEAMLCDGCCARRPAARHLWALLARARLAEAEAMQ